MNPEILDRLPPCDLDAEKSVLGSILLRPAAADDVADVLRPEDFYADANRRLFACLLAMRDAGRKIDVLLLTDELQRRGELEAVGGTPYIGDVLHSVPHAGHAAYHAALVARAAKYRRLIDVATGLLPDAYGAVEDPEVLLNRTEAQLAAIGDNARQQPIVDAQTAAVQASARIDAIHHRQQSAGLLTGLPVFDTNIGGLFPGELVILAARPGVGKSALACQIAQHCGERQHVVYIASLEMTAVELATRTMCSLAGVNNRSIRTGKLSEPEIFRLNDAALRYSKAAIKLDTRASLTVADIRRAARRLVRQGLRLVIVDYLQRVQPADPRAQRYVQVGQITDGLKQLACEFDLPVLCLCQLSREAERDTRPGLRHLRESGSIEQDADVVLILDRPRGGITEKVQTDDRKEPVREVKVADAVLSIEKNRNGETAELRLNWFPEQTRFECVTAPNYEPAFDNWGNA